MSYFDVRPLAQHSISTKTAVHTAPQHANAVGMLIACHTGDARSARAHDTTNITQTLSGRVPATYTRTYKTGIYAHKDVRRVLCVHNTHTLPLTPPRYNEYGMIIREMKMRIWGATSNTAPVPKNRRGSERYSGSMCTF